MQRRTSFLIDLRRIFLMVVVLAIGLMAAACPKEPQTAHKRLPPSMRTKPPDDVVQPGTIPPPPGVQSHDPKRKASQQLVDRGIEALDSGDTVKASQLFQDAMNVDAQNGIAYFYLAKVNAETGQPDAALGLLDKAEILIGDDTEWQREIEDLRANITGESQPEDNGDAPKGGGY